ncbi:MAG: NAD+ synthase [Rhodospirillaceae bacterium]|nr:NAD+ synthase [Rhodospirillaceae bacterium]
MTDQLAIALAQLDPTVGRIDSNLETLREARAKASAAGADLILTSELYVCGYPPEDLVRKPLFVAEIREAIEGFVRETADGGPAILLGTPWVECDKLHNSQVLIESGTITAARHKHALPNYGVFDEKRVFDPGPLLGPVNFRDVRIGVPVCEDIWTPDVIECITETGGELILVPNGSPFEAGKADVRLHHTVARVVESGLPLVYLNQVGGQDELVFDGASFVMNSDRTLAWQMAAWREDLALTRWRRRGRGWLCDTGIYAPIETGLEAIYQAMTIGLRDYVNKNGFPGVILGLSGGIDSAISAAVAVDALGPDRVHCVMMPSPYTREESLEDAAEAAHLLGTRIDTISIGPAMQAFGQMLSEHFEGTESGVAEENIQSRSRGLALMALSNKFGAMVLSTGNKSEMSVGYATLYGDMCGGYSVLKDVYKSTVLALSRWRNLHKPRGSLGPSGAVMPDRIITKPPSAELKPDQIDQDSLPPYDELDAILECLIEDEASIDEIVAKGFAPETVMRTWQLLDRAEYKRRQAPPGVKIGCRAFGRDRRYPITNAFEHNHRPKVIG